MSLLDWVPPEKIHPADPNVIPAEIKRLSRQNLEVLELLKRGPARTDELCRITHRFSARFYDLRQAGYVIECVSEDTATGLRVFALKESPAASAGGSQDGGNYADGSNTD